jgi:hypothetical protein
VAVPRGVKQVRSLKRSERAGGPVTAHAPRPAPADSKLPEHRHSEEELAEIRHRSAVAALAEGGYQQPEAANTLVLTAGYLLAIGGAAAPTLLKLLAKLMTSYTMGQAMGGGYHLLVGCALAALPVAAFIYFKKTLSRHHAAFMTVIAAFSLVFATVHYFNQLQYAP